MIRALSLTGEYLDQHARGEQAAQRRLQPLNARLFEAFEDLIVQEHYHNGWFTESQVRMALGAIAYSLSRDRLEHWMNRYPGLPVQSESSATVGVIMAGNIPAVGFHDMLSVIMSGHRFLGKVSSKDERLMKMIARVIIVIEPRFEKLISFTEGYLRDVEAIIATGSDNTSRYFEYYFSRKPHIIRRNRNGVAILEGSESRDEILKLGKDVFSYYGLGCRNVTKLFIPAGFDPRLLLEAWENYPGLSDHHKYNNNLQYNRSVYLMNRISFLDNGSVILKEDERISSPVGVVYFEKYSQLDDVIRKLDMQKDQIQCVVSGIQELANAVPPGQSQYPGLDDYSDGIDTMEFLTKL